MKYFLSENKTKKKHKQVLRFSLVYIIFLASVSGCSLFKETQNYKIKVSVLYFC